MTTVGSLTGDEASAARTDDHRELGRPASASACYCAGMSNVQVRNVPDEVVAALKRRAAGNRQSLQRYLVDVLTAEAAVASNTDVLDEAAGEADAHLAAPGEAAAWLRRERAARDGAGGDAAG